MTSEELIAHAAKLEEDAADLRAGAYSLRHTHYWPAAEKIMQELADKLDKLAISIRRIAA